MKTEEVKLTKYEQEIEEALAKGYFERVENFERWKEALKKLATAELEKRKSKKIGKREVKIAL